MTELTENCWKRIEQNKKLFLIAGPCVIESEDHALMMAREIKKITDELGIFYIFKSSFDKANRTSATSFRGVGLEESITVFDRVRWELGIPTLTDVHEPWQCELLADHVDVMQIPAFLCRQTDLLRAAANTGSIVNIKKGQFLSPQEMAPAVQKVRDTGNQKVMITERGTFFGYNCLVNDFTSLTVMGEYAPVVFDATHSVQKPGAGGNCTLGNRSMVPVLARAAVAVGVQGLFMEVHEDPDRAPSDGPNMLKLRDLKVLLQELLSIDKIRRKYARQGA